jgi:hypothetical protein
MLGLFLILACKVDDRAAGDRTPNSLPCDELDTTHCMLPWPSNTFTVVDDSSATGLRLDAQQDRVPGEDDVEFLNLSDGFSRVTGVAFAFEHRVPEEVGTPDVEPQLAADGAIQVFNAQLGSDHYGQRQGFWIEHIDTSSFTADSTLLVARPEVVLEANADHVAIALDSVGGSAPESVQVALGLLEPGNGDERALAAYHAPTRAFLEEQGVDLDRVVRVTDFTTRSAEDPTFRTHAMMEDLDASLGDLQVEIDSIVLPSDEHLAAIVRGRLTGAPGFLDEDGRLVLDDEGRPMVVGTSDIEFRISLPAGEPGDLYKVALYGHGTGGNVSDNSFDAELAEHDIAKLNLRFDGWTDEDFLQTLTGFTTFLDGSERSTAGLMQSVAGGTVLLTALDGVLGDALSADTIAGEPNPVAGRLPDTDYVVWVGGSLGGTLGAVIVSADERLTTAVLNVPGTGWSHMIPHSLLYDTALKDLFEITYGHPREMHLSMVMGQNNWDDVDGAVWADEALAVGGSFLLQESMDDPVLPNLGTNLLANALSAKQLTPVLDPIYGLEQVEGPVTSGAALEQYRVPDTGVYDVHGFAARNTIAGHAALEQILMFLDEAWEGQTPMEHPELCTEFGKDGTCDFTEDWVEY